MNFNVDNTVAHKLINSREILSEYIRYHNTRLQLPGWAMETQLADLSDEENRQLTFQINRLLNVCGCFQAGLASGAAVLLIAGYLLFSNIPVTDYGIADWALMLMIPAVIALLVKTTMIASARIRLLRHTRVLLNKKYS